MQLFLGDTNRTISETPMNMASSRSHCVFTIYVEARQVKHGTSSDCNHSPYCIPIRTLCIQLPVMIACRLCLAHGVHPQSLGQSA